MRHERIRPPVVRLPPKTGIEMILATASRVSLMIMGLVAVIAALHFGRTILVPITLAVTIGLMFGPYADRLDRAGLSPWVSSAVVVLSFLLLLGTIGTGFAVPLSEWTDRLPAIWAKIKTILADWQGSVATFTTLSEEMQALMGREEEVAVAVRDGGPATEIAFLAPELIGQMAIFFASLYFFIATRDGIRVAVLRLCMNRRLRWRAAHIFRDAEAQVSRYLVSITWINMALGAAVALAMFALGVPTPLLWGLLAAVLNYVVYIGPAVMALILLLVGLATFDGASVFAPAACYLFLNFLEAQFATPQVLGRRLTINPFVVFLAIVFWLWIWGPAGGFVAVPLLLITTVAINHILPLMPKPHDAR